MICLTVIARNEARCLARCLQSAAPFVDEMLVVDTGSTDDTRQIARTCGARVAHFTWIDDFSAARNFALAHTGADWRLVLDADEWLESGGAQLRHAAASAMPFVGEVSIRSAFDDGATVRFAPSWIARFLPKGVEFAGRIHEQVVHRLPVRRMDLVVGHDGYRREQQHDKGDRNERLLRLQILQAPDDPYMHFQLGKDLQVHERFAQAIDAFGRARALLGWPAESASVAAVVQARHGWLHDLVARELYCLKRMRRFGEGAAYAQAQANWWQFSADFHFAFGDLLLDYATAEPARADVLLPVMEACWLHCLALGENPNLEGAVEGRGSFLAAHNLAVYYELTGRKVEARKFRALARAPAPGGFLPGTMADR